MKILFAVNNDNVSEAIVKKYQQEYKEILSYKNVYYFNAILRELQKDKSYSRIVISEDLEPFANNNYDAIDKFLFEKYNNIADEIKNMNNEQIEVILVCADRRKKTDNMLVKIYKKDIYNAIVGQDRSIDEICRLINQPRDKEAAKRYYNIQENELGEDESENSVSEAEVENIRVHYARLGKNEDKYVESFNNIVAQYTDTQLKIIIKYLPMNVKAVLEERSPKYQQLVTSAGGLNGIDTKKKTASYKEKINKKQLEEDDDEEDFTEQLIKAKKIKSVVVPTNLTTDKVQKVAIPKVIKPEINKEFVVNTEIKPEIPEVEKTTGKSELDLFEDVDTEVTEKSGIVQTDNETEQGNPEPPKRGRGRPRKNPLPEQQTEPPKRGRGRPRKNPLPEEQKTELENKTQIEDINLFDLEENKKQEDKDEVNLFETEEKETEIDLFNIEEEPKQEEPAKQEVDLFNMGEEEEPFEEQKEAKIYEQEPAKQNPVLNEPNNIEENTYITRTSNTNSNFNSLLTGDKKIVAFVGTTKNGTSFIVNNTAEMLASMGIETAILDMTKSRNAYYIYTNNEESLRIITKNCMENLQNGIAEGIKVKKNLSVYTEMPDDIKEYDMEAVLATLLKNYSAVLIDTDFDTKPEIFEKVQELYLVQTMDVLTIQPLTAFLRNLKSKGVLQPEKLKIVINKSEKVRSLSVKTLIGGMSCYNSPNMTYMTELFNKDNIRYVEIPFETQNYVKYLDSLVNCSISLNGYTKQFIMSLRELANMVYPLISKQSYSTMDKKKVRRDPFSNKVNDTLNRMKTNY